jgi:chitin synthase
LPGAVHHLFCVTDFVFSSNGALVIAIENVNGLDTTTAEQQDKQSLYFQAILWATAGLSAGRFFFDFRYSSKRHC